MDSHVWEGGNDLLLWGKLWRLLKLKVTNGTGQSEVAVDTPKVDKSTGSSDASLLTWREVSTCPRINV